MVRPLDWTVYGFRLALSVAAASASAPPAEGATVAYYRFEEGQPGAAGGSVSDSSGNGSHGTAYVSTFGADVPAATVGGAPNARSMEFTGVGRQRVYVPDSARFASLRSMTVEAFIRPRPYPGVASDIVFRGGDDSGNDSFVLNLFERQLRFVVVGPNNLESIVSVPDTGLYGRWSHVAGTIDDATGVQSLYVNGVLAASRTTSVRALGPLDPNFEPGIGIGGTQSGNYDQGFSGSIDEVRISDVALAPAGFLPEPSGIVVVTAFAAFGLRRRR